MVASVFSPDSILPDMFAASVGTAFFAVFATQPVSGRNVAPAGGVS